MLREFTGHTLLVGCLAFLPDGRLVSGSPDGTLWLWDVERGRGRRLASDLGRVRALAVAPEGRDVVCRSAAEGSAGDASCEVSVWDGDSGTLRERLPRCSDVVAVAHRFPFRSRCHETTGETVIEEAGSGTAVAWFPTPLRLLTPHPTLERLLWAGAAGNHLYLLELLRRSRRPLWRNIPWPTSSATRAEGVRKIGCRHRACSSARRTACTRTGI